METLIQRLRDLTTDMDEARETLDTNRLVEAIEECRSILDDLEMSR